MSRPILLLQRFALCSLLVLVASSVALAQKPGTHERTLESGGKSRDYLLHIPKGYSKKQKKPVPMVVMLHGRTGSGAVAASPYYGWKQLADKEKFIAVFPTALGTPTSWQGAWRGEPTEDSKFLAALIEHLKKELRVDADRVFMTGHSSGGFMSFSFAVTHPKLVSAIAPVAGLMVGTKKPSVPVSVISFHGMSDDVVPYAGGDWSLSARESAAHFAAKGVEPERTELAKGKVHVDTWSGESKGHEAVLYSIEGGGHGWPKKSDSIGATGLIWEFFEKHPRKGEAPAQR